MTPQDAGVDWNAVVAIATLAGVAFAGLSAWAAFRAARATQKAAEGGLVLQLLKDYAAPDMANALRTLRHWSVSQGDGFARQWAQRMETRDSQALEVDAARRRVSSFFLDTVSLHEDGLLSAVSYRRVVNVAGLAIFVTICVPMEREIDPAVSLAAANRLRQEFPAMANLILRVLPARDRR